MSQITGKSEFLNDNLFENIIKIIESKSIKIKDVTIKFNGRFWKKSNQLDKKNYSPTIDGCFLHFAKILWKKAKAFRLCKKSNLKNNKY